MIVPTRLTKKILDWCLVKENLKHFNSKPKHRSGLSLGITHLESKKEILKDFPHTVLKNLSTYLLSYYDLPLDTEIEDRFGYLISYSEKDHKVGPHTDPNKKGEDKIHCRINLIVSKPIAGGDPIISDEVYPMLENEVWLCIAGLYVHDITITKGDKPRILISLGYYIDRKVLEDKGWICQEQKNTS